LPSRPAGTPVNRQPLHCFGCGRDGSIYDFAAALLGRGTRGQDFIALRRELTAISAGSGPGCDKIP
jgi:hypothetical protein